MGDVSDSTKRATRALVFSAFPSIVLFFAPDAVNNQSFDIFGLSISQEYFLKINLIVIIFLMIPWSVHWWGDSIKFRRNNGDLSYDNLSKELHSWQSFFRALHQDIEKFKREVAQQREAFSETLQIKRDLLSTTKEVKYKIKLIEEFSKEDHPFPDIKKHFMSEMRTIASSIDEKHPNLKLTFDGRLHGTTYPQHSGELDGLRSRR